MTRASAIWRVWVDTGGTFTDCVALSPQGDVHRAKALSTAALRGRVEGVLEPTRVRVAAAWAPQAPLLVGCALHALRRKSAAPATLLAADASGELTLDASLDLAAGDLLELRAQSPAPTLLAHLVTQTPLGKPLPPMELRLATTKGTNALLERAVARTAFFVNEGFGDLLRIGDQRRPDIFALRIVKPQPLHDVVCEISGRIDANGCEIEPLDEAAASAQALRARAAGCQTAAVALLHSWRNSAHERRLAELLRQAGFSHISLSHELAPRAGLLRRAQTAVVDAALSPILREYLEQTQQAAPRARVFVLSSAGGLKPAQVFRPSEGLLSGPAGGVMGARAVAAAAGADRVLTFDMGGTSADVAKLAPQPELTFTHRVGEATLYAPAVAVETVAAGGGSICSVRDGAPVVGPESAGADPGPACYGKGGPLTLTDVNLLLGRLDPTRFETPLDLDAARAKAAAALRQLGASLDTPAGDALLEGFLDIANERMAEAIRRVSTRKGDDPADFALLAFGGAGPQHAAAVASALGMRRAIVPHDASLLSAVGLGAASLQRIAQAQTLLTLDSDQAIRDLDRAVERLRRDALELLTQDLPTPPRSTRTTVTFRMRYTGQEHALEVVAPSAAQAAEAFARLHLRVFGHTLQGRAVEVESVAVAVETVQDDSAAALDSLVCASAESAAAPSPVRTQQLRDAGAWREAPVFDWDALAPGAVVDGPALVSQRRTCAFAPSGWRAVVGPRLELTLARRKRRVSQGLAEKAQAVRRELIVNRLLACAEQMGAALERTAVSVNVKDRLDFSCALLSPAGELVASAPHIPVHLGALGACCRALRAALGEPFPGDVWITNHPAHGGSHLPDVTVVAPVFDAAGQRLLGWTASRAHHAEIGGVRPGSMAPTACALAEEGVVIAPMKLHDQGEPRWEALRSLLEGAPFPSRAVGDNLADAHAQVAAAVQGAEALRALAAEAGVEALRDAMDALLARSEAIVKRAVAALPRRVFASTQRLDDGCPIAVRIEPLADGQLRVDFTGSGPQRSDPFNAPASVVRSAVAYVMRLLVAEQTPLNEGLLRPVELVLPEGSLLAPRFSDDAWASPPVAAGNVETSQRVVDALLAALQLCACGQGTMNNVAFGGEGFSIYETLGGGSGAGPAWDGADAVHVHMSNTAVTDVELLELRAPVRVEAWRIRQGSGGAGAHRGGDGLVRRLRFLAPASVSLLTQRRRTRPCAGPGGGPGEAGRQLLLRPGGAPLPLGPVDAVEVEPGEALEIHTPGGGGWGAAG